MRGSAGEGVWAKRCTGKKAERVVQDHTNIACGGVHILWVEGNPRCVVGTRDWGPGWVYIAVCTGGKSGAQS